MDEPTVRFERVAPMPVAHPRPWFPMLPVVGRHGRRRDAVEPRSRFLEPDAVFTASGSAAITWALRDAGLAPGDRVGVPAYHCPTMVTPIIALGAQPVFVPVDTDLAIRLDAVVALERESLRALILPHFFGFVQPELGPIREWADARGVTLIEDCAHAFYGTARGFVPGRVGHYAIASTRKFFAGVEGGAVVANGKAFSQSMPAGGWLEELKAIYDTVQQAAQAGALIWQRPAGSDSRPVLQGPLSDEDARSEAAPGQAPGDEVALAAVRRRALRSTVALIRCANHRRLAEVRRARYRAWQTALAGVAGVRPFRDALPDCGVPYVFPLHLADAARQYRRLKYAGVQVWRWDRIAVSDCRISRRLAIDLVQLPCCPSLPDRVFDALLDSCVETLRIA